MPCESTCRDQNELQPGTEIYVAADNIPPIFAVIAALRRGRSLATAFVSDGGRRSRHASAGCHQFRRDVIVRSVATKYAAASLVVAGVLCGTGTAFANDSIQASVSIPVGQPIPVMTENGTGYTPGTYAIGTIRLEYTYVGFTFQPGAFATFNLNMGVYSTGKGAVTPYPVTLDLTDIGSPNVTLSPANSSLLVSGVAWTSSVPVIISIPSFVPADPLLNGDGAVLVGNFKLDAGNDLKTVTNVQVKIRLVHPDAACLKVYDFITDADLTNAITSTEVGVNKKAKVTSTNPYGSLSENLMVVNTCATTEVFDARISLDPSFTTQPNNNPGNAVFTFATAGEMDPATFNIASFGTGTAQGQKLCLQSVSVPAGSTFLATVHMSINNGMAATALPGGGTGPGTFSGFEGVLYTAGSVCAGTPISIATPNPASAPLAFTIK